MEMGDDGGQAHSTPKATSAQAVDLTIPNPSCWRVTPTGGATQPMGGPAPPDIENSRRARPGHGYLPPHFETHEEDGPVPRYHTRSSQQPGKLGSVSFLTEFLCWYTTC